MVDDDRHAPKHHNQYNNDYRVVNNIGNNNVSHDYINRDDHNTDHGILDVGNKLTCDYVNGDEYNIDHTDDFSYVHRDFALGPYAIACSDSNVRPGGDFGHPFGPRLCGQLVYVVVFSVRPHVFLVMRDLGQHVDSRLRGCV